MRSERGDAVIQIFVWLIALTVVGTVLKYVQEFRAEKQEMKISRVGPRTRDVLAEKGIATMEKGKVAEQLQNNIEGHLRNALVDYKHAGRIKEFKQQEGGVFVVTPNEGTRRLVMHFLVLETDDAKK